MSQERPLRLKVRFSKLGAMRFISHLDLWRLFQRASRRADIPAVITKGFRPRLKISIMRALKLGVESDEELAIFYLEHRMNFEMFRETLNEKLPKGIRILEVEEVNY